MSSRTQVFTPYGWQYNIQLHKHEETFTATYVCDTHTHTQSRLEFTVNTGWPIKLGLYCCHGDRDKTDKQWAGLAQLCESPSLYPSVSSWTEWCPVYQSLQSHHHPHPGVMKLVVRNWTSWHSHHTRRRHSYQPSSANILLPWLLNTELTLHHFTLSLTQVIILLLKQNIFVDETASSDVC